MLLNGSASQVNGGENCAAEQQRELVNGGKNCARQGKEDLDGESLSEDASEASI